MSCREWAGVCLRVLGEVVIRALGCFSMIQGGREETHLWGMINERKLSTVTSQLRLDDD